MRLFYEIPGLNIYLQIIVTVISITVQRLVTRGKPRESLIETFSIFTVGLFVVHTIEDTLFQKCRLDAVRQESG